MSCYKYILFMSRILICTPVNLLKTCNIWWWNLSCYFSSTKAFRYEINFIFPTGKAGKYSEDILKASLLDKLLAFSFKLRILHHTPIRCQKLKRNNRVSKESNDKEQIRLTQYKHYFFASTAVSRTSKQFFML